MIIRQLTKKISDDQLILSFFFSNFSQAYSAQTVLFLVTPRSTHSVSFDLFLVRGRIFFNPTQYSQ